jgi:hypothetical protein
LAYRSICQRNFPHLPGIARIPFACEENARGVEGDISVGSGREARHEWFGLALMYQLQLRSARKALLPAQCGERRVDGRCGDDEVCADLIRVVGTESA